MNLRDDGARWLIAVWAAACLVGCMPPKPIAYLRAAQDQATDREVRARLGMPSLMKPLPDGGTEWIYRSWAPQAHRDVRATADSCDEYRLLFDEGRILRKWDHASWAVPKTLGTGVTMKQGACHAAMAVR